MATTGKKINELTSIETVSNETVLPAVYVNGTTPAQTAQKISINQISNKVQDNMSSVIANKQDKLTAGDNISIDNNNVISATNTTYSAATENVLGLVKPDGTTITVAADGTISSVGGSVPEDVWTQDNLLAGENITIDENPKQGGIDEHTKTMLHFDAYPYIDSIPNTVVVPGPFSGAYTEVFQSKEGFDKCLKTDTSHGLSFDNDYFYGPTFTYEQSFTIDFIVKMGSQLQGEYASITLGGNPNSQSVLHLYGVATGYSDPVYNSLNCNGFIDATNIPFTKNNQMYDWTHVAIVQDAINKKRYIFIDGHKLVESSYSVDAYSYGFKQLSGSTSPSYGTFYDEFRISDVARWTSDFTPLSIPYHSTEDEPTTYSINATGMVKSQTVQNIVPLTQAEYDDLAQESAIDPNTFYLIKSAS